MTGCGRQDDRLNDSFKVQRDEWMDGWLFGWQLLKHNVHINVRNETSYHFFAFYFNHVEGTKEQKTGEVYMLPICIL